MCRYVRVVVPLSLMLFGGCDAPEPHVEASDASPVRINVAPLADDQPEPNPESEPVEFSDQTELRVFVPLPMSSREPVTHMSARVIVDEVTIEEFEVQPPYETQGDHLLVTLPRSFDTMHAIVELTVQRGDAEAVRTRRALPAGIASQVPQRPNRPVEVVAPERHSPPNPKPLGAQLEDKP